MVVTIAANKGGVGKSTTAVHVAAFLQSSSPTALIDDDPNRSATRWKDRGALPFEMLNRNSLTRRVAEFTHFVRDTPAQPSDDELREMADGSDLLVIVSEPDVMSLDTVMDAVVALKGRTNYRVLLTKCRPAPNRDAEQVRAFLLEEGVPLFASQIPLLIAFPKAAARGMLVSSLQDPRADRAWSAYNEVGKEIVSGTTGPSE